MFSNLSLLTSILTVLLLSLVPSFEGRYALVIGIAMGLHPLLSFTIASLGIVILSLLVPRLIEYIDQLIRKLGKKSSLKSIASMYFNYLDRVRRRVKPYVDRYGFIGLVVFVALPIPGSGVWTGSIASYVLGFEKKKEVPALILGGILSNLITLLTALGSVVILD